ATLFAGAGCKNPTQEADRAAARATTQATVLPISSVDSPAALQEAGAAPIANPKAAVDALAVLKETDPRDPKNEKAEQWAAWQAKLATLGYRERDAVARGTRAAGRADRVAAIAALNGVLATPGATASPKLDALLRIAAIETDLGEGYAEDAAEREGEAARLRGDARVILDRVAAASAGIGTVVKADPAELVTKYEAARAAAEGSAGGDGTWGAGTTGPDGKPLKLLSLSKLTAEVDRLEKDVQDLKRQRAELIAASQKLTTEAAQADARAEVARVDGRAEVAYNAAIQAADLRKKAAETMAKATSDPGDGSGVTTKIVEAEYQLKLVQIGKEQLEQERDRSARRKADWEKEQAGLRVRADELRAVSYRWLTGLARPGGPAGASGAPVLPSTRPSEAQIVNGARYLEGRPPNVTSVAPAARPAGGAANEIAAERALIETAVASVARPTTRPGGAGSGPARPTTQESVAQIWDEANVTTLLGRANALAAEAQALRDRANEYFNAAAGHLGTAEATRAEVEKEVKDRLAQAADGVPERAALAARLASLTRPQFLLRQADIRFRQARLQGDRAIALAQEAVVREAAERIFKGAAEADKAANIEVPTAVTALSAAADADKAATLAYDEYRRAETLVSALLPKDEEIKSLARKPIDDSLDFYAKLDIGGAQPFPAITLTREAAKGTGEAKVTSTWPAGPDAQNPAKPPTEVGGRAEFYVQPPPPGEEASSSSSSGSSGGSSGAASAAPNYDAVYSQAALALLAHLKYAEAGVLKASVAVQPDDAARKGRSDSADAEWRGGEAALIAYRALYKMVPPGTRPTIEASVFVTPKVPKVEPGLKTPVPASQPATPEGTGPGTLFDPTAPGATTQPADPSAQPPTTAPTAEPPPPAVPALP
ncbi:MAG TPA: hypothetical protein VF796_03935, partial [Humisphaera sp.]